MKCLSLVQFCFSIVCLTLFTMGVSTVSAQNVDFELPKEINVIQGRLSVVFNDGVTEKEAQNLIKSLGYSVLQTSFNPLAASAITPRSIPEEELEMLRQNPQVLQIEVVDLQAINISNIESTSPDREAPRYQTKVIFKTNTSENEALRILSEVTNIAFHLVEQPANELIIEVGDEDETAFSQLDGHANVKWVTYVGVADY